MPKKITWDEVGERLYETGVKNVVLYPITDDGNYNNGVAWNGITAVNEKPSGADTTDLYANDALYATLQAAEKYGCTIEAYTYPDEFEECDGTKEITPGITIGQQERKTFGLSYRTAVGNDVKGIEFGYKLHLVYGCKATPSEKSHGTINESPEAGTFSWEVNTIPVNVEGYKPTSTLTIDSTKVTPEKLAKLENILYGSVEADARLPLPAEVANIFKNEVAAG